MRKLIIFIIVLTTFSSFGTTEENRRFYSSRFAISINLTDNYIVTQKKENIHFENNIIKIDMYFYKHSTFQNIFNIALRMGQGKIIGRKKNVRFAHLRMLRASRGGYIIFKAGDNITHFTILKKEYRYYIFKSFLKHKDLIKLKDFIASIRLELPEDRNYEGERNGVLYRLVISSDYSFRLSLLSGNNTTVFLGSYKYKNSTAILTSSMKIIKSGDANAESSDYRKVFRIEKSSQVNSVKFGNVILKPIIVRF